MKLEIIKIKITKDPHSYLKERGVLIGQIYDAVLIPFDHCPYYWIESWHNKMSHSLMVPYVFVEKL